MTFKTEADLCAAFIEAIDKRSWVPYAETAGWDILLARRSDGLQIGVQAKLKLNVEVINQAIEEYGHWAAANPGPDLRAVLVPAGATARFVRICDYLGLHIFVVAPKGSSYRPHIHLPDSFNRSGGADWHEWCPTSRIKLPEYVPDVRAGAPAPIQLTNWKIKAIKLAVILETRGFVLRSDFGKLQLDHRRWIANEWIVVGKHGYVRGGMPDLRQQHPVVYEKIKTDMPKWWKQEKTLF